MKYQIVAPPQKRWVESEHAFEAVPAYDSVITPNKNIFGVRIEAGRGETDDPFIAVEFFDMGYSVDPDPHPEAVQKITEHEAAKELAEVNVEVQREALVDEVREKLINQKSNNQKRGKARAKVTLEDSKNG